MSHSHQINLNQRTLHWCCGLSSPFHFLLLRRSYSFLPYGPFSFSLWLDLVLNLVNLSKPAKFLFHRILPPSQILSPESLIVANSYHHWIQMDLYQRLTRYPKIIFFPSSYLSFTPTSYWLLSLARTVLPLLPLRNSPNVYHFLTYRYHFSSKVVFFFS